MDCRYQRSLFCRARTQFLICCRFDPGPTFARSWANPTLSCTGLDPATHEIWLLQLPLDVRLGSLEDDMPPCLLPLCTSNQDPLFVLQWRFDAEVKLDVKRANGPGSAMATCIDSRGQRWTRVPFDQHDKPMQNSKRVCNCAGDRFSVTEEHASLASSLYVASPALKVEPDTSVILHGDGNTFSALHLSSVAMERC